MDDAAFIRLVTNSVLIVVLTILGTLVIAQLVENYLIPWLGLNGVMTVLVLWQAVNTGLVVAALLYHFGD